MRPPMMQPTMTGYLQKSLAMHLSQLERVSGSVWMSVCRSRDRSILYNIIGIIDFVQYFVFLYQFALSYNLQQLLRLLLASTDNIS